MSHLNMNFDVTVTQKDVADKKLLEKLKSVLNRKIKIKNKGYKRIVLISNDIALIKAFQSELNNHNKEFI